MGEKVMQPAAYTVKHGHRKKTVALRVLPNGEVTVYAPKFISPNFIDRFVDSRANWIEGRRRHFIEVQKKAPPLEFVSGETIHVLGRPLRLEVIRIPTANGALIGQRGNRLRITISADEQKSTEKIRNALEEWLTEKTASYVLDHVGEYKKLLGVSPTALKVVSQGKRWGSCSRKGALRFNWKLSMMPPSIINYVIVHELCHLKVHNHSERFWNLLQSVLPDFQKRRNWLRSSSFPLTRSFQDLSRRNEKHDY